jgi:hypothetical protein
MEGELLQARQEIQARLPNSSRQIRVMHLQVLQQSCDSERRLKHAVEQRCEAITRDLNQCASCCHFLCFSTRQVSDSFSGIEINWPSCAKIRTVRRLWVYCEFTPACVSTKPSQALITRTPPPARKLVSDEALLAEVYPFSRCQYLATNDGVFRCENLRRSWKTLEGQTSHHFSLNLHRL